MVKHIRICALFICLGVLGSYSMAGGGVVSPLQGTGEIPFSADLPVFYPEFGPAQVNLALRVFERDLVRPRPGERKRLGLRLRLARSGVVVIDTLRTIEFSLRKSGELSAGSWTEPIRLIEIDFEVEPGVWAVTLDLGDGDGARSRATGVLEVVETAGPRLSDPQFRLTTGDGTLPWPDRVYGLNQDTLEVYFEVTTAIGAKPLEGAQAFRFEVHDPRYGILDEQQLLLTLEAGKSAAVWRLPVGDFPEGSYGLKIVPPWETDSVPMREFSISWRIDRALEGGDELLVEAELALLPVDYQRFVRLSRARQIQMLEEFWSVVDPTPGTARNETRNEFRGRITKANRLYHTLRGPGALSDRGRIFTRYGSPRLIDTEVMPRNGDDLELAIQSLHDIYTPEVDGVMARGDIYGDSGTGPRVQPLSLPGAQASESVDFSSETATDLRRNAAKVGREGGFEVWKYEYSGRPLLDHHRPGLAEQQDIRFIFVDRRGVGDYRLEFSNLPTSR
jgi:GWxTD domain-containing protein